MRTFRDRVAVVTGAASGIGRATAERLAWRGCHVALVDIDEVGLEAAAAAVRAAGRRASIHPADVADRDRMQRLADEVVAEYGGVHLLMNNAGVSVVATFEEHSLEDWDWIVGINFWGVVHGCKFFLPHLRCQDEAHVVNVSSMFGFLGLPTQVSYCASKAAVKSLSESLWTELRGTSVGVTSVHPGGVKTRIVHSSRTLDDEGRERTLQMFERFAMPPERAAESIIRAVERNRARVIIGREAYLAEWAKRLLPIQVHRAVAWAWQRDRLSP